MNFKLLLKSSSVHFLITKYISYGITLINALLIANYLGVFYFGIYGFASLLLQYLSYTNFGINYSLNVILSTEKDIDTKKVGDLFSVSIFTTTVISVLLIVVAVFCDLIGLVDLFNKYILSDYYYIVIIIAVLQYYNIIFITLFRIYGKLSEINFNYLILPIGQLLCIIFFKGEKLLWAILINLIITSVITLLVFIRSVPVKIRISFPVSFQIVKTLFVRGLYLLAYNASFYFIIIAARTIVSYFYKVEEFSLFNFANSFTNAILIFIGSIEFLFYPKMLNVYSKCTDNKEIIEFNERIRKIYLVLSFLIIFISLIAVQLVFYLMPKYSDSVYSFMYLLIAQLIICNGFGYSTFLVQRKKEGLLTIYGVIAILFVLISGIVFAYWYKLSYEYIAISVIIGTVVYNFLVIRKGNKLTQQHKNGFKLLAYIYNYKFFLPVLAIIIFCHTDLGALLTSVFTLVLFIVLNVREIIYAIREGLKVITRSDVLNIKIND